MNDRDPSPRIDPDGIARRRLAHGREDLLVREEPLLLVVHGEQLLTMRTPGRDEDLARGFVLAEGIARDGDDIASIETKSGDGDNGEQPDQVHVQLRSEPAGLAKARLARTHEIRSSCGICGVADAEALLDDAPPLLPGTPRFARGLLTSLQTELAERQELFALTGGCHGALLADVHGNVRGAAEDVGRHNALDKAIGEAVAAGAETSQLIAVLSGRAGFDLIVKCLRMRIAAIASVSAPSSLAFDLCRSAGATLIGFLRADRHEIYCGAERVES